ncbi:MAG: hypothetical protein ABIE42_03165 [Candidatus Eisenbacteria bacterium]
MTRIKRATIVLPLVVLLLGAIVPVLLERDEGARASDVEAPEVRVSGRTAGEWATLAAEALEQGRLNRALSCIKTAESVGTGVQYAAELKSVRRARWRVSEVNRLSHRLSEGSADHAVFDAYGAVVSAHRLVTVLPGESLWTLARDMVAAGRRVPAADVSGDDRDVYRMWDSLTALNGVRELEVGERVRVSLLPGERAALVDANRRDLERVAAAAAALASGKIDEAARLRGELEGTFAESTSGYRSFDGTLNAAIAERDARRELDRENTLAEDARKALARIPELPRATRHSERLDALNGAQAALAEAEALRAGAQYPEAAELVARLLSEETRFSVAGDGVVLAAKPPGVTYTQVARSAVEWMLERELRSSGGHFPRSNEKSPDERAWARYLAEAARAAEGSGSDFAALLEAVDEEMELRLPDPVAYFAD